jgi:hypothetical protein
MSWYRIIYKNHLSLITMISYWIVITWPAASFHFQFFTDICLSQKLSYIWYMTFCNVFVSSQDGTANYLKGFINVLAVKFITKHDMIMWSLWEKIIIHLISTVILHIMLSHIRLNKSLRTFLFPETFEVDISNTKKLLEGERGQTIAQKGVIVSIFFDMTLLRRFLYN